MDAPPRALLNQMGARVGDQEDRHRTTVDECVHGRLKDCDDSTSENATYWQITRPNSHSVRRFHKVVAAWRFAASSNRYYWWRG